MPPTLAEILLSLITDQPLSKSERWEVALHVMRLTRRATTRCSDCPIYESAINVVQGLGQHRTTAD